MFQQGGPWMVAIAILLALSIAVTLERFMRLFWQYSIDGRSFMFEVQKQVLAGEIDNAIRLCNATSLPMLPKVLKAGLQRASRTDDQIHTALEATSLEVIPRLEHRLSYLALISNVAVLFGLLGTITGLIKSFQSVALADPGQRQAMLSAGISEAMNATAFGLITAIFSMMAHAILSNRANRLISEIDEFGAKLLDLLSVSKGKGSKESKHDRD